MPIIRLAERLDAHDLRCPLCGKLLARGHPPQAWLELWCRRCRIAWRFTSQTAPAAQGPGVGVDLGRGPSRSAAWTHDPPAAAPRGDQDA